MSTKSKAFIIQPMNNLCEEEILKKRNKAIEYLQKHNYEVVDTYFNENPPIGQGIINPGIWYLAKSIHELCKCEAVYVLKDYELARGCLVEVQIAKSYGLTIIYEA